MSLRSPIYLDTETLHAQAEYHEIDVPRAAEIVENTRKQRSGGGKLGTSGVGANASLGNEIEVQSTYTLSPREKVTVSRAIDDLIRSEVIKTGVDDTTVLSRDNLVEVEGTTRITSASLAGKAFHTLRKAIGDLSADDIESAGTANLKSLIPADSMNPALFEAFTKVYLHNELLPIPVLLEVAGTGPPCKVNANLAPDHFVDAASQDRIEGELRVLGTVSQIVDVSDDGYFSAERWILHGWEYLLRRFTMLDLEEQVTSLVETFGHEQPPEDVYPISRARRSSSTRSPCTDVSEPSDGVFPARASAEM